MCVVFGFVFHVFVQPCRVPGTNNDQEALKRKCEENVERHHLEGKSFILYVSSLTSQPFVGQLKQCKLHNSTLDLFSFVIKTLLQSW